MNSKIFILVTVLLLVVSFIAQIARTELGVGATYLRGESDPITFSNTDISPKLGLFGTLNKIYARSLPEYADVFVASKFDWHWTYTEHSWRTYTSYSTQSDILAAGGKRVILCTEFWSRLAIPVNTYNWTDIYNDIHAGGPLSLYADALDEIIQQVSKSGVENLWAITIGNEEPVMGYWFQAANVNVDHFTEVYNMLYDDVKAAFPNLRVLAALFMEGGPTFFPNVLSPAQVRAVKKDGLILTNWYPDLAYLSEQFAIYSQFKNDPDVQGNLFTYLWCSTPKGQDTVMTPDFVRQVFDIAKNAGIENIGFYAQDRTPETSHPEWIYFNEYEPDPELDAVHDPYGFRQVLLDILENSAAYIPGDANEDGVVNILDITKVKRIIMGLDDPTPGADANEDGNINALDITQIELIIMGS